MSFRSRGGNSVRDMLLSDRRTSVDHDTFSGVGGVDTHSSCRSVRPLGMGHGRLVSVLATSLRSAGDIALDAWHR